MESNRTGEIDCKISIEERTVLMKTKTDSNFNPAERNGDDGTPRRQSRQSSQTPEYVKRTAKLFETVKVTRDEVENCKNGIGGAGKKSDVVDSSSQLMTEIKQIERETVKISLDSLDGDYGKKPSYLGVSCSNSGYRNVINYDSKLREGFWKGNSQRESLVLCSSRMRESSPLRRDYEFKSLNGGEGNVTRSVRVEKEMTTTTTGNPSTNGISHSHPEKFVNISTSTKTISTFRNSKDMKGAETERSVNGIENGEAKTNAETKVNLKQILNGKSEEPYRKGYSNLGFSPKILKSPEKNCNSFLKSINSFENNWKKSQRTRSSTYPRPESTVSDSNNSIQQRIERLYGPGALAQGFYTGQKPNSKTSADKPEELPSDGVVEPVPQSTQPQTPVLTKTNLETNNLAKTKPPEVAPPEQCSNGHVVEEEGTEVDDDVEKNGIYFLKLLKKETDRLERLASFAESELENGENLPEEISGKLRSAAGKARLLVCQKLNQFEGLCQKNLSEKPSEPFRTTNEDLAGFWDMVMLQVVQVYGVFDELEQLKKNNWKSTPTKKVTSSTPTTNGQSHSGKTTPKKSTPTSASSAKSEEAKKAREETRRKLLEERRKKMKELKENKIISNETEVEIFAK